MVDSTLPADKLFSMEKAAADLLPHTPILNLPPTCKPNGTQILRDLALGHSYLSDFSEGKIPSELESWREGTKVRAGTTELLPM